MKAKIARWGNSIGIRIPRDIAKDLGLQEGGTVQLEVVQGGLLLRRKYTLANLLEGATPDMVHEETNWGAPVGGEVW